MFYNCDCIDGAKKHLKDNSVDLIITDPPYGISGEKLHKHYNRNEAGVIGGYVEVSEIDYPEFSRKWIVQAERVLKPGGSIYIVSGYTQLRHILNSLADTNLIEKNHIIWKFNFGVFTSKKYVSSHYHILYYVKPGSAHTFNTNAFFADSEKDESGGSLNYKDREDVWIINREFKPGEVKNKNELPKTMLTKMILYSSQPDDLVCDFFLGSFSTAKAAIGLGRNACGFELNKMAFLHQQKEIQSISKGYMLNSLRPVPTNIMTNRGKTITDEEAESIQRDYKILTDIGTTKKAAIVNLTVKYGRGYWSLLRIIDGTTNKSKGN